VADRGIIFSAPMVRALLDGRKTQTRRIIKPCPWPDDVEPPYIAPYPEGACAVWHDAFDGSIRLAAPFVVGDRLYVRENWQALSHGDYLPTKSSISDVRYAATDPLADADKDVRGYPWRPSIHMPRWASRLWLAVTEVRVQRLQGCSEADAIAEGIQRDSIPDGLIPGGNTSFGYPGYSGFDTAISAYTTLWNSLHTGESERWEDDPWVCAISFTVHHGNIDMVPA